MTVEMSLHKFNKISRDAMVSRASTAKQIKINMHTVVFGKFEQGCQVVGKNKIILGVFCKRNTTVHIAFSNLCIDF